MVVTRIALVLIIAKWGRVGERSGRSVLLRHELKEVGGRGIDPVLRNDVPGSVSPVSGSRMGVEGAEIASPKGIGWNQRVERSPLANRVPS